MVLLARIRGDVPQSCTTGNFEDLFDEIDYCYFGLIATKVVRSRVSYVVPSRRFHTEERGCPDSGEDPFKEIVVQEELREPDVEVQNESRRRLEEIYENARKFVAKISLILAN